MTDEQIDAIVESKRALRANVLSHPTRPHIYFSSGFWNLRWRDSWGVRNIIGTSVMDVWIYYEQSRA